MMNHKTILLLTLSAFMAAAGQLSFKLGANNARELMDFMNGYIFVGLILYGGGTIIWIYVLSSEMLVSVYAFTALSFVLVYAGSILFLGENINRITLLGIAFVLAGLYLITTRMD